MLDFDVYEAITFDCYGTLIDWERGIVDALRSMLHSTTVSGYATEDFLELFGRLEADAEQGAYRSYREVLTEVARGLAETLGVRISDEEAARFAESVGSWPPFDDTVAALRALATRYRLAVLSNVDDDLFARSARMLDVDFEHVVTAQQVRSYKPAPAHFHEAARRLDLPTARILHVAQSLYHDVAPARRLGIRTVWVNRRRGKAGGGATKQSEARPDMEVASLMSLVSMMGLK